jgi:hypothetical protein
LVIECVQQEQGHCGPASVEMLFSFNGLTVPQRSISGAAGMTTSFSTPGMRLDELSVAVDRHPQGEFYLLARYHSNIDDITRSGGTLPAGGVEWQGRFPRPDGGEFDLGHYSVITAIDPERDLLYIADPEENNLLTTNGSIAIRLFEPRWWEVDVLPWSDDFSTTRVSEMERLMFVVACPQNTSLLVEMGFARATLGMIRAFCVPRITLISSWLDLR